MRKIKYIGVHCTGGLDSQSLESIQAYWKNTLGWKNPGYHYLIFPDGTEVQLLSEDKVSNGVKGFNSELINVCYVGGMIIENKKTVFTDTRTDSQKATMLSRLKKLKVKYPDAIIKGHRDFSPDLNGNGKVDYFEWIKVCPCFDAMEEYKL
ncbi:N-acetylmuramoyl-L-alanine amidase [Dysgonomonas hofstadii]|uniref:N-acetylmuramoyl-L-alanine amidase n=1 Tax=Dysgonomonas hofstadii TaxID=637886 RepID=A0A840CQX7_9BACT|nr:N-acetylmuramoyl-L-alanine amidase [Dysgonomonas hofstadii]MBB4036538.1 N-acetylmuramoyl-L-alanine amidase [Dysgonomonas hofstadii]